MPNSSSARESPRAAAIAALAREDERAAYYAKTGVMGGLGITFGTQIGALLLGFDFRYVALAAAGSYVILLILIVVWLPAVKVAEEGGAFRGLTLAFRDHYFLKYLTFSSGQQFMSAQFSITLPLVAVAVAGNAGAVAWALLAVFAASRARPGPATA